MQAASTTPVAEEEGTFNPELYESKSYASTNAFKDSNDTRQCNYKTSE
jgi:hypothetical protein